MSKKIFLLIPGYSSYLKPISKGFKDLGWQVKNLDYRRGDTKIRILRFIPIFGGFEKAEQEIKRKILRLTDQYKPDIILTVKGESLDEELLEQIKKRKVITANWFPEHMNQWELTKKVAPMYDFFFNFDPFVVKKIIREKNARAYYLPFAAEIESDNNTKKIYEITFIGTYTKYREEILSQLKGFSVNIWGDPRWKNSKVKKFVRGGRIKQNKMKKLIQQTKINLNIYYDFHTDGASLRTFEVIGRAGFLLSEDISDLKKMFKINKEIVVFKSEAEMKKLIRYYLQNNKERQRIAENGFKRAVKDHNYKIRLIQMLDIIQKTKF